MFWTLNVHFGLVQQCFSKFSQFFIETGKAACGRWSIEAFRRLSSTIAGMTFGERCPTSGERSSANHANEREWEMAFTSCWDLRRLACLADGILLTTHNDDAPGQSSGCGVDGENFCWRAFQSALRSEFFYWREGWVNLLLTMMDWLRWPSSLPGRRRGLR